MIKEIKTTESPILDTIVNCTCAALDQTGCEYIVALFGHDDDDCKIANITLNVEDELAAAQAFAKVIGEKNEAGMKLLRLLATIIHLLPEEIWNNLDLSLLTKGMIPGISGGLADGESSASIGGGISF